MKTICSVFFLGGMVSNVCARGMNEIRRVSVVERCETASDVRSMRYQRALQLRVQPSRRFVFGTAKKSSIGWSGAKNKNGGGRDK